MISFTSDDTIFAERAADDDADGHVHYVALEGEFLELLEECHDSNVF